MFCNTVKDVKSDVLLKREYVQIVIVGLLTFSSKQMAAMDSIFGQIALVSSIFLDLILVLDYD